MKRTIVFLLLLFCTNLCADENNSIELKEALQSLGQSLNGLAKQLKSGLVSPPLSPRAPTPPPRGDISSPPPPPPRGRPLPDVAETLRGYLKSGMNSFYTGQNIDFKTMLSEYKQYQGVMNDLGKQIEPEIADFIDEITKRLASSGATRPKVSPITAEELAKAKLKKTSTEDLLSKESIDPEKIKKWNAMSTEGLGKIAVAFRLNKDPKDPELLYVEKLLKEKRAQEEENNGDDDDQDWS